MEAKIYYDYEIDELVRDGGLGVIPLVGYLYESFPQASFADILYTTAEHVKVHGLNSDYPHEIIHVPQNVETKLDSDIREDYSDETDSFDNRLEEKQDNQPKKKVNDSPINADLLRDISSIKNLKKRNH